jgi:hypothetical protein
VREAYGVNPRNGQLLYSRDGANAERPLYNAAALTPAFYQGMTAVVYEGLGEGQGKLQASARENRLAVTATLVGESHPHVRVGGSVNVVGFGAGNDGAWYVSAVDHDLKLRSKKTMRLSLGRDTADSAAFVVAPALSTVPATRGVRLVNGRWVLG